MNMLAIKVHILLNPFSETGVDVVDLVWEGDPDHEVAVDDGAGAK